MLRGNMLIRNFGHLWERKFINYGTGGPGNRGHLKGYNGKEEVDFREQIGIYVLFDKDFVPVYIWQAGRGHRRLFDRLNEHETDDLWNRWDHFSWFGFRRVNKKSRTLSRFDSVTKRFSTKGSLLLNEAKARSLPQCSLDLISKVRGGATSRSITKQKTRPWRRRR